MDLADGCTTTRPARPCPDRMNEFRRDEGKKAMSITIHADVAQPDYAAVRADGYDALITLEQCGAIAVLAQDAGFHAAYPADGEQEIEWYGHAVLGLPFALLDEPVRTAIFAALEGNEDARDIVHKGWVNALTLSFSRSDGDRQYRVSLNSERADAVDLNLCSGNWKAFRDVIGLDGQDQASDIDCGSLPVAQVEMALLDKAASLAHSGDYVASVATRLRAVVAYAKANGATTLTWA